MTGIFRKIEVAILLTAVLSICTGCQERSVKQNYAGDIAPGKKSGTLNLSDNKRIRIEDLKKDEVIKQPGVSISKTPEGILTYTINNTDTRERGFNILITQKGEQAQLALPDGSLIWLNAGSSVTFPTTFSGSDHRAVRITGEAYFEIAQNDARPFFVKTDIQDIRTTGAHFNVSRYPEEITAITTVLEGSIQVNGGSPLKPGQGAEVNTNGITILTVRPESAVAWKNDKFTFEAESIEPIMRQVARWYNAEVVYEGDIPDGKFSANISRTQPVSALLSLLESTGDVRFKIEGRKITVMK